MIRIGIFISILICSVNVSGAAPVVLDPLFILEQTQYNRTSFDSAFRVGDEVVFANPEDCSNGSCKKESKRKKVVEVDATGAKIMTTWSDGTTSFDIITRHEYEKTKGSYILGNIGEYLTKNIVYKEKSDSCTITEIEFVASYHTHFKLLLQNKDTTVYNVLIRSQFDCPSGWQTQVYLLYTIGYGIPEVAQLLRATLATAIQSVDQAVLVTP